MFFPGSRAELPIAVLTLAGLHSSGQTDRPIMPEEKLMLSMRKFLAVLFAGLMLFSGVAMATPPGEDPTCENPGGPASGQECAGDNGSPGCEGVLIAESHAPEQADPAFDLVTDILSIGEEGECEEDQRGGRPGGS